MKPKCLRCASPMVKGVVLEGRRILSTKRQELWVAEETGALAGQKIKDLKGRPHLPVSTYRCTKCGMLEAYAT